MPEGLYDTDALAWAEQQADLLRRLMAGERVNAAIDWENVIEEVQDVGLSQLRSVQSLLTQALQHLIKIKSSPESPYLKHWRDETRAFLDDALHGYTPSMRQRVDLDKVWLRALRRAALSAREDGYFIAVVGGCPLQMSELLTEFPDLDGLLTKLPPPSPS